MGASGAPWFVNPIKAQLPLLEGDGRVSSSDDITHETSASTSTEAPSPYISLYLPVSLYLPRPHPRDLR